MHAKSGLRVVLKWMIFRPDSVIADVILRKLVSMSDMQFGEKSDAGMKRIEISGARLELIRRFQ